MTKTLTLNQIESQIAKLQREAQALRARQLADVVGRVKATIAQYGLTPDDLFGGKKAAPNKRVTGKAKAAVKKPPAPAKYRDDAGHTWSGHGKRPNWYKAAIASGKTPQDLEIKA